MKKYPLYAHKMVLTVPLDMQIKNIAVVFMYCANLCFGATEGSGSDISKASLTVEFISRQIYNVNSTARDKIEHYSSTLHFYILLHIHSTVTRSQT
jgi:hypothetical protein